MEKKLYRSITDKKLAGVCGGLAEYFNLDPTVLRVIMAILVLCASAGLWIYLIAALVMPKKSNVC